MSLLYAPFIFQGLIIFVDEEFHKRRGLGAWERIGHPLDTMTVLMPLSFVLFTPYSESSLAVYLILSAFSCLFITKDEFIHAKVCSASEQWLHSLLFILHPLVFLTTFIAWSKGSFVPFLKAQAFLTAAFLIYQVLRWSIPWTLLK